MNRLVSKSFALISCAMMAVTLVSCQKSIDPVNQEEPPTVQQETRSIDPIDQSEAPSSPETVSNDENSSSLVPDSPEDLQITEYGYWFDEYGSGHYAVIIENPNLGWAAERINVNISGKDSDGNLVGTDSDTLTLLFGNGKTALCGRTFIDNAESLEFQIINSKSMWSQEDLQQAEFDQVLYAENINVTEGSFGSTTVSGEAVNLMDTELSLASTNVVFRASDGSIVGGASNYTDTLTAESSMPFSVDILDEIPPYETVEVYLDCGSLFG